MAIVNPAAGNGRCRKLAADAMEELKGAGVPLQVVESRRPGDASRLAQDAWSRGWRRFVAVGGDGTSFEIINGLFPGALGGEPPTLAFLPLGRGNSFLRDFTELGAEHTIEALRDNRSRPCDVLRMRHKEGTVYYMNLLSIGFPADVASVTNRRFKRLGELGYLLGVLTCLARLNRRAFPLRLDEDQEVQAGRCLFLTFNNSKYTGGRMMIAPKADSGDGLIEVVRWGPIGRVGLLRNLSTLYDGSHLAHPLASRRAARRVEFFLDGPVDVMVDGEVMRLHCEQLDVLPSALRVVI